MSLSCRIITLFGHYHVHDLNFWSKSIKNRPFFLTIFSEGVVEIVKKVRKKLIGFRSKFAIYIISKR